MNIQMSWGSAFGEIILFFLTDLSYVGFVPVGDLLDMAIQKHFTFVARINHKNIDLFLTKKIHEKNMLT
jgi:hypothetical protein